MEHTQTGIHKDDKDSIAPSFSFETIPRDETEFRLRLMEIPQPRLRLFSRGSSENISNRLLFIFLAKRNKKFLLTAKRKSSSKIFIFILDVAAMFN